MQANSQTDFPRIRASTVLVAESQPGNAGRGVLCLGADAHWWPTCCFDCFVEPGTTREEKDSENSIVSPQPGVTKTEEQASITHPFFFPLKQMDSSLSLQISQEPDGIGLQKALFDRDGANLARWLHIRVVLTMGKKPQKSNSPFASQTLNE